MFPFAETIPEVMVEVDGLVFWLVMLEALTVKSFPAKISEEAELVKLAALIVKLSVLCKLLLLAMFPEAVMLKVPPETMLPELDRLARFRVKLLFD